MDACSLRISQQVFHDLVAEVARGMAGRPLDAELQDWLNTGAESRINTPGKLGGNWQWRLRDGDLPADLAEKIARMTRIYGRSSPGRKE